MNKKNMIALFAGKGELPELILQALGDEPVFILVFEPDTRFPNAHVIKSMGQVGLILDILKKNHIKKIIFAGHVKRPAFSDLNLDFTGIKWMAKIGIKSFGKDDTLLSLICVQLEREGFEIIKPEAVLGNLMAKEGVLTQAVPSEVALCDIMRGRAILEAMSAFDVGQSIVVQNSVVLGIEAAEGTQALIRRCAQYMTADDRPVLVKMAKVGQNDKVDMPTIGLETIRDLVACGFAGVCVQAGKTQFLNQKEAIALADAHGVFVVGV